MDAYRQFLIKLPRAWKRLLMVLTDAFVVLGAFFCAAALHGLSLAELISGLWQPLAPLVIVVSCGIFLGLYSSLIRYISLKTALRIAGVATLSVVLLSPINPVFDSAYYRLPVLLNFGLLLAAGLAFTRVAARQFFVRRADRDAQRMMIYGAGEAGVQVARALESDRRYRVLGFVDDNVDAVGKEILGLPVLGSHALAKEAPRRRITNIVLALPSISRTRRREIVAQLETLSLSVKTVPALQEILSGHARITEIRDIEIEDLLGREPVPPHEVLFRKSIAKKTVMVTGAGGSIGSELCRQILAVKPAQLILFETSEVALFEIEREFLRLRDPASDTEIHPVLGNVLDKRLVRHCIEHFGVDTLYHAAAFKHVPMVERNVRAGLRNNVLGTWNVAAAAYECEIERFILVSTDKAVRPTNVMGATKRVAELIVQAMAERVRASGGPGCVFSMVRFGNVLGSSGSVVPYFREQIAEGGPVTVTHPDVTRYFMTIPEAAQLVIQAGAMASGGEVFVLDMGQPIRIADLAERMIRLAGYSVKSASSPEGDIEIVFTELRPGEKLYEELLHGEDVTPTAHPKIGCAHEQFLEWPTLEDLLTQMYDAALKHDARQIKSLLARVISEYAAAEQDHDVLGCAPYQAESDRFDLGYDDSGHRQASQAG